MERMPDEPSLTDRERAELAALADGTLRPRRQAEVQARVDASPPLRAAVEEQRRARAEIRAAAEPAPASLRAAVQALGRDLGPRGRRRGLALGGALAGAVATGALALALLLPGDLPGGPTVVQAAELSRLPPSAPAPKPDPSHPALLSVRVDGVAFPNWAPRGWRTTGMRSDVVAGRRVVTVFYARGRRVVGYQVVAGRTLPSPVAVHRTWSHGTSYRSFTARGETIVTWTERGRTCILSGRGVSPSMLRRLAAW
jgi:anti-sigma factor RsiW